MDADTTRRELLRSTCRWGALVGLGGWVAYVAVHSDGRAAPSLCARCPVLQGCTRPDGVTARQTRGEALVPERTAATGLCGLPSTGDEA